MPRNPEFFEALRSWFDLQTQVTEPTEQQNRLHSDKYVALTDEEQAAFHEAVNPMIKAKQKLDIQARILGTPPQ